MVLFVDTETKSVHIEDAKGLDHVRLHDQCRQLLSEAIPNNVEEEWTYSYSAVDRTGYPGDNQ
eukprot:1107054-Rhodomonas_salina.1